MARDEGPSGFLVVDKPGGWTSHDVVDAARRWLGTRRIGHLGTLDPLATGVLPLAVRDATKLISFVSDATKRYEAEILLGAETDTLDADGRVTKRFTGEWPTEAAVRAALAPFLGEIQQVPPMFSAVKRGGVPLHRLARQGEEVERAARTVTIHALELLGYAPPSLEIALTCTAGTYVRVLASEVGRRLGCFGHVRRLRRAGSGPFRLDQAASVDVLEGAAASGSLESRLIPPAEALGLPRLRLAAEDALRVRHGGLVRLTAAQLGAAVPGDRLLALDTAGDLLAVLEVGADRATRPLRVVASS